jgi:hypothetical protein
VLLELLVFLARRSVRVHGSCFLVSAICRYPRLFAAEGTAVAYTYALYSLFTMLAGHEGLYGVCTRM